MDINLLRESLVGLELNVSLQPYHGGRAVVVECRQSHEYGRPDRLLENRTTIIVAAMDMTTTNRLFGQTSSVKVDPGTLFDLHFHDVQIPKVLSSGRADYVYPV